MSEDSSLLLSGSSDHTIRLWDLGQQRCLQTLAVHTDSVWSLHASHDFGVVYSGGRDSHVYRWDTFHKFRLPVHTCSTTCHFSTPQVSTLCTCVYDSHPFALIAGLGR